MSQLDEALAAARTICEQRGHKPQTQRSSGSSYAVRRCVVCGHVTAHVAGGPVVRVMAWFDRLLVEPWTTELGYAGRVGAILRANVAGAPEQTIQLHLRPRSWRMQGDGRVTELASLGGDTFRLVWRDLRQRIDALTGGWPDYGAGAPTALIRVRAEGPLEAGGEVLRGTITVIDVT
jgi:hypothetical protein